MCKSSVVYLFYYYCLFPQNNYTKCYKASQPTTAIIAIQLYSYDYILALWLSDKHDNVTSTKGFPFKPWRLPLLCLMTLHASQNLKMADKEPLEVVHFLQCGKLPLSPIHFFTSRLYKCKNFCLFHQLHLITIPIPITNGIACQRLLNKLHQLLAHQSSY